MRHKHSRQSDPNEFMTHIGDTFHILREGRLNPDGTISLRESGRENIKDKINSYKSQTDMALIIAKLQAGDSSVLNTKPPMYADFTQFPKTYAEAYELVTRSEKAFESLPVDVKQSFDNDRGKWFATIGSPEWLEKMGFVSDQPTSVQPTTVEGDVGK